MFAGENIPSQQNDDVDVKYEWGDGTLTFISNDPDLEDSDKGATTHTYPATYGSYTIKQVITNHTTGCADSTFNTVTISFVSTDFVFDIPGPDDSVCLRTPFTMTENSSTFVLHEPMSYLFTLRDTIYAGSDPESTFPPGGHADDVPGTYQVSLITTNAVGCSDTAYNSVTIFELPIAGIDLLEDSICKETFATYNPSNSQFGGYTGGWQEFRWSYNDGSANEMSTLLNQDLTHNVSTNLQISLQVVDAFGCVSENTEIVTVTGIKPVATFTANTILCNNTVETIDGSPSLGLGPLNYAWSLNGNPVSNNTNPVLQNAIIVSPPDTTKMEYTYELIVTDSKGCKDTTSQLIMVSNPRVIEVDTTVSAKYVDGNGNFTCPPVVVDFELSYISNWPVSDIEWSFGNDFDTDIDSYNEDPKGIQYVRAGSYDYSVFLTESVTGCQFSRTESPFLIIGGPRADVKITADSTDNCGLRYLFEVSNQSDNLDYWYWDLGDGIVEQSQNNPANSFYHTYLDINSYDPVLTLVDDSTQCMVPIPLSVDIIGNGLNAYFTADPTELVIGFGTTFTDGSSSTNGQIVNWAWDFGDGSKDTLSSSAAFYHQYVTNNSPTVTLTVIDEYGCTDQYQVPLTITVEAIFPNIITGMDGVNSVWTLFADIFQDFEILIVNRWGNVVYEGSRDPANPRYLWDGIDQKSGKPCSDGTYFYIIKGFLIDGREVNFQDFLTIVGHQ